MSSTPEPATGLRRRSPDHTKAEILDAASAFLQQRPFRELTIGNLMAATSVGRSTFYRHFPDKYGLAAALLGQIDEQFEQVTRPARSAGARRAPLDAALEAVVRIWEREGPVIRAIAEASAHDERLEALYRRQFLQSIIDRVRGVVELAQHDGRVEATVDAGEWATLIVLMEERYLGDRLGRLPQADPATVLTTVSLGVRQLLGVDPAEPS